MGGHFLIEADASDSDTICRESAVTPTSSLPLPTAAKINGYFDPRPNSNWKWKLKGCVCAWQEAWLMAGGDSKVDRVQHC